MIQEHNNPSQDIRCICGKLLAKITRDRVELKCHRCKNIYLIPFQQETYNGNEI